jgi:hypothetical protein
MPEASAVTYRIQAPGGSTLEVKGRIEGAAKVIFADPTGTVIPHETRDGVGGARWRIRLPNVPSSEWRLTLQPAEREIRIYALQFSAVLPDADGNGIPDLVEQWIGVPPGMRMVAPKRPERARTIFQTGSAYRPEIAVPADAVLLTQPTPENVAGWQARGYEVRAMTGFRMGRSYAMDNPTETQTDRDGRPLAIGADSYYVSPTPRRTFLAQQFFRAAIDAGVVGICPEEPEYLNTAGYEPWFRQQWQNRYGEPWRPPHADPESAWRSARLMSELQTAQLEGALASTDRAGVVKMAAVHSLLNYALWGVMSLHSRLAKMPGVEEIVGQVWTGTARSPVRAAGSRRQRTFDLAWMEYSSLQEMIGGTGRRLWLLMDPVEDDPTRPLEDYRENYIATIAAALMLPEAERFEVMPWPERIFGTVAPEYRTQINTLVGALAEMAAGSAELEAGTRGIGIAVADSLAWQRHPSHPSDMDGLFGPALALLSRAVPVRFPTLERFGDTGYLDRYAALFINYDVQKPADHTAHRALTDWVNRGGALIVAGGQDPYNNLRDGWWKGAGFNAPTDHLLAQFGVSGGTEPLRLRTKNPETGFETLAERREPGDRHRVVVDLTRALAVNGAVEVEFRDPTEDDGNGPAVYSLNLKTDDRSLLVIRTGTEIESRFLQQDEGSIVLGARRFADRRAYWTYQFSDLPSGGRTTLELEISGAYRIRVRSAVVKPITLQLTRSFSSELSPETARLLQRIRLPGKYAVSVVPPPMGAVVLAEVDGSPVAWRLAVGRGAVLYLGVDPAAWSATANASHWIRTFIQYAAESCGRSWAEKGAWIAKRGAYTIVRSLTEDVNLPGSWVDLLSPQLSLAEEPVVAPGRTGIYLNIGKPNGQPRMLAASGRVTARYESAVTTAFVVRAPASTEAVARIWAGRRKHKGVKAVAMDGSPVDVSAVQEGETLLVRWMHRPEGVAVKVGW